MVNKHRLITLMLASIITPGVATLAGCSDVKSGAEKNCENEIRKLLEYDANIVISKNRVEGYGFDLGYEINNPNEYLIIFRTKKYAGRAPAETCDKITYSVDKDFFYDFKNSYSEVEGQNEVDLVTSLTSTYDPIEVITNSENIL